VGFIPPEKEQNVAAGFTPSEKQKNTNVGEDFSPPEKRNVKHKGRGGL